MAVVWMAVLQRGRKQGDFALIRRAHRELGQIGVKVTFRSPQPQRRTP